LTTAAASAASIPTWDEYRHAMRQQRRVLDAETVAALRAHHKVQPPSGWQPAGPGRAAAWSSPAPLHPCPDSISAVYRSKVRRCRR
jgi:hypothetical protein